MPEYLHPGVYVTEIPSGSHTIQAASTSTACFIGETLRGRPFAPTLVTSFVEYSRIFGELQRRDGAQRDLPLAARLFFENGGSRLYIVRVVPVDAQLAKGRIGGKVNVEARGLGQWGNDLRIRLKQSAVDPARVDLTIQQRQLDDSFSAVESFSSLGFDPDQPKYFATIVNRDSNFIAFPPDEHGEHYREAAPGGAITELGLEVPKGQTLAEGTTSLTGGTDGAGPPITAASLDRATESLARFRDVSVLAVPGVWKDDLLTNVIAWARERGDVFMVLDSPGDQHNSMDRSAQLAAVAAYQKQVSNNDHVALYFPWIEVADPYTTAAGATRFAPPSGFIAGLYARTDNNRGVWKAPAGTEAALMSAVGLAVNLTDVDQDTLNPVGINAIRRFDGAGIVVWGARTQGDPDGEYLYVPVRRTANYLRQSIQDGTQWVVFEPNDVPLWRSIADNVDAFMSIQFRSGAFQGGSTKEAYFVLCDSTNNTQATIDAGQVHIMVGFAPLKPADFVVLQLVQIHQEP